MTKTKYKENNSLLEFATVCSTCTTFGSLYRQGTEQVDGSCETSVSIN